MKAFCHSFWLLLLLCQDDVGYMIDAKLDSKQEIDSVKTYKKVQKTDIGTKKCLCDRLKCPPATAKWIVGRELTVGNSEEVSVKADPSVTS